MLTKLLTKGLDLCDSLAARFSPEPPGLAIFTFHSIFDSQEEIDSGLLDPQQGITTRMFRQFVADFHRHGYHFVSPEQVINGLDPRERYVLVTFDDGYYNNLRVLTVLEEFQVPAIFCISTNYVELNKAFWWDVLYRESRKRKWSHARMQQMRQTFKALRAPGIDSRLCTEFGLASLQPVSDLDRPLTAAELGSMAKHSLVHIGNHTCEHAILTNYFPAEIKQQIVGAQEAIYRMTGQTAKLIAYPNGNLTPEIAQLAHDVGLQLGVTVQTGKNRIASTRVFPQTLALKRFTLWGNREIEAQCRVARSSVSLRSTLSAFSLKFAFANDRL